MLMYALHLVLGAPFDFTSCDFPNIWRWWALILLENFGVFSESAETVQESLPCEEQATLSSSEAELPIIRHMKEAVKWLHSNSHLLRGPVDEPLFIPMNEDDKEKARNNLLEQSEASREPFLFHFVFRDDMELFLQECKDKMGLRGRFNILFLATRMSYQAQHRRVGFCVRKWANLLSSRSQELPRFAFSMHPSPKGGSLSRMKKQTEAIKHILLRPDSAAYWPLKSLALSASHQGSPIAVSAPAPPPQEPEYRSLRSSV
ncbi:uncharacterized protein LOC127623922 [Xyrauchen texanus]|uniref:uncharacterized protein LOC127623922 n=1 Tax=Xyrauchen texanus TaxID=154827 RepID=UPI00224218A3|nr:uncharacterized protein LOC127623922 [Xyrauchen texanus]